MEMDITDRKKIELELRESEKKFRETVENLDEGYFRCTIEGELLDFNQSYQSVCNLWNCSSHIVFILFSLH